MGKVAFFEWTDALGHRRFWISAAALVIVFGITVASYSQTRAYFSHVKVVPNFVNAFNAYLQSLGSNQESLFVLALPLFAALPKGDAIPVDRHWGADSAQLVRVGWRAYLWGKWLGNIATVACLTIVGLGCAFVMATILYPVGLPHVLGVAVPKHPLPLSRGVYESSYAPVFDRSLYFSNPWLYAVLTSVVPLWATLSLASLATALSVFVRRSYLALALPVIAFWGMNVAFEFLRAGGWAPSTVVVAYLYGSYPFTWPITMLYWLVPFALGVLIVGIVARTRTWPQGGDSR